MAFLATFGSLFLTKNDTLGVATQLIVFQLIVFKVPRSETLFNQSIMWARLPWLTLVCSPHSHCQQMLVDLYSALATITSASMKLL